MTEGRIIISKEAHKNFMGGSSLSGSIFKPTMLALTSALISIFSNIAPVRSVIFNMVSSVVRHTPSTKNFFSANSF